MQSMLCGLRCFAMSLCRPCASWPAASEAAQVGAGWPAAAEAAQAGAQAGACILHV